MAFQARRWVPPSSDRPHQTDATAAHAESRRCRKKWLHIGTNYYLQKINRHSRDTWT